MTVYKYLALKNQKEIVKGKIEAENPRQAREAIRKLGFIPTKLYENDPSGNNAEDKKAKNAKIQNMTLQEKIEFTSTFQILASSGIPVIESLVFIENDATKPKLRQIAKELRLQIMAGSTFSDTIAKYPHVFGQIYIGLAKAGEDSGELDKTMERLLELLKKEQNIRSRVTGTLMYPAFVVILAMFIVIVMLVFVFPAFKDMFANQGKELPWITATLMSTGEFLKTYWLLIPMIFAAVIFGTKFLLQWETSKRFIDEHILNVPIVGEMMCFSNFSNFIAVMQVAYDAGVPIVDCLYLSDLTLTNYTLQKKISQATAAVQQGQHLSAALKGTGAIPKMILFMISTGEQSGRLGDMLQQATVFIDKKLDDVIDTMSKMVEPIMLLVIGSIVLVLALALYLPLFQSYAPS